MKILLKVIRFYLEFLMWTISCVGDPDPHVFGPSGSGSFSFLTD
jgi:hypothetical protein